MRPQEPERDPEEQHATDRLQAGDTEQERGQRGKDDAQSDGASATDDDRSPAVLLGEAPGRHTDDDRVVTRKDEVDDDNAEDGSERFSHEGQYSFPGLKTKSPSSGQLQRRPRRF